MKKKRNVHELIGAEDEFSVVELEDETLENVYGGEHNCGCADGGNCVCHGCDLNFIEGCGSTEIE